MKAGGFRPLFEDKPVLLRLPRRHPAMDRYFARVHDALDADLAAIRRDILSVRRRRAGRQRSKAIFPTRIMAAARCASCTSADGSHAVYKPKDLRLDVAWHDLIERLNRADPPVELKAVRAIAREGYGWTEFVEHQRHRSGRLQACFSAVPARWLALLHCFAAADMHQENIIAAGDHPVPIDLETIFHTTAVAQRPGCRRAGGRSRKRNPRQFDHVGRFTARLWP